MLAELVEQVALGLSFEVFQNGRKTDPAEFPAQMETKSAAHTLSRCAVLSLLVLTSLHIKNFKSLEDVEIDLGKSVVFVGPNNSGKTTALQALALWEIGLRKWLEKRGSKDTPEKRPGVTINRRDLIAIPVPDANLLWTDLHTRVSEKRNGKPGTKNICIQILVSGITEGENWKCGFEFDYANQESFYCRPLRLSEDPKAERMTVPSFPKPLEVAFLPPMSGLAATEDSNCRSASKSLLSGYS
jgi:AAA ATPase domain